MIKTVFIDIDDTLLDFAECSRVSIIACCREYSLPYSDQLFSCFSNVTARLWREIELGTLTRETLLKNRWNIIFSELGIDFDGKLFEKAFRANFFDTGVKLEYSDEILDYLSKKYVIYAASNAPYAQQVNRLKKSGLYNYFNHIFTSEQLGYNKPDRRFFDSCIHILGNISPSEIIMIGDSLRADIAGAAACGIITCHFERGLTPKIPDIKANYTVTNLLQIKDFL